MNRVGWVGMTSAQGVQVYAGRMVQDMLLQPKSEIYYLWYQSSGRVVSQKTYTYPVMNIKSVEEMTNHN